MSAPPRLASWTQPGDSGPPLVLPEPKTPWSLPRLARPHALAFGGLHRSHRQRPNGSSQVGEDGPQSWQANAGVACCSPAVLTTCAACFGGMVVFNASRMPMMDFLPVSYVAYVSYGFHSPVYACACVCTARINYLTHF